MGIYDDIAMKAGKELSDVVQEAIDKDDRMGDTIAEGIEAAVALNDLAASIKAHGLDKKKAVAQVFRGALNDVLSEDLSLDEPYAPGSQK